MVVVVVVVRTALLAGAALRFEEALADEDAGVDDAALEAFGAALATGVRRPDVLAHVLDDGQQLRVLGLRQAGRSGAHSRH